MHQLRQTQDLPLSLKEAWDFFSSPKNLKTITPPYMGFDIVGECPDEMYEGAFIQYKVKPLFNFPTTWVTEITHVKAPHYFVDEQRHGPYKIWHHQHFFEEIEGGVRMTDIIDYRLPMGALGKVMHPIIVRKKLNEIFRYRKEKLDQLFGEFKP